MDEARTRSALRRHGPRVLVALVVLLGQLELWDADVGVATQLVVGALLAVGTTGLLVQHRAPFRIAALTLPPYAAHALLEGSEFASFAGTASWLWALAGVARMLHGRQVWLSGAALLTVGALIHHGLVDRSFGWDNAFFWVLQAGVLVLGVAVRGFRERSSAERRATALAAARDEHAREAVAEERARLARELHDVVSHSVAVMIVQAEAGDVLLDDDPARARSALRSIAASGRDALLDLRRLLGVLRAEEGAAALGPQPGVGAIESLLDDVRAAGLDVDLAVEGRPEPLPVALDLSAYRIVQEGLTNVIRHAGGARARVTLRYEDGRLGVEVSDDGHVPASPAGAAGRGLIGVRERVALYGGEVEAGPRADGGFTLRAVLPLDRSPA